MQSLNGFFFHRGCACVTESSKEHLDKSFQSHSSTQGGLLNNSEILFSQGLKDFD